MAISDLLRTLLAAQLVYVLYKCFYRLFLSPLATIPGPKLAALSGWYEFYYDVLEPAQYVFKIQDLHKKYGPIVRITPREISVSDLAFLDTIYSPNGNAKRNKDTEKVQALGINTSVGGAVSHDLHRKRRESLNPFFSQKAVLGLQPQLASKVEQLGKTFADSLESSQVINLSDLYFAFASDVVSQYSFGHNANILSNLGRASAMRINVSKVLRNVKFNLHFGWVRRIIQMLPTVIGQLFIPPGIKDMLLFRMKIRHEVQQVLADTDESHNQNLRSVFYEFKNSPNLPAAEKTVQRLEDEGTLLVMAGTESTAKSIGIAHYYLLANPDVMAKLRTELSKVPEATLSQLQQLPYLNAVIAESNRLSFGLTGRNPRVSPTEPMVYTDPTTNHSYTIPAETPVSISTLLVHANETVFPNPWTFDPDRWLGTEGQERRKYLLSFGKGPRTCIGINLANAELCLTIAEMAKWDMRLVDMSEMDVKFLHDYHVATPQLTSQGIKARVLARVLPKASRNAI